MATFTAISASALRDLLSGRSAMSGDPEFVVEPNYDPEEFRRISQRMIDWTPSIYIPDAVRNVVLPLVLVLGLISAIFWSPFVTQIVFGIAAGLLVFLIACDLLVMAALSTAERLHKYTLMARKIFGADSQYWRYVNFEEQLDKTFPEALVWLLLFTGALALGWYLVAALVIVAVAVHVYSIRLELHKGESLISYRKAWEDHQKKLKEQEAAAADRQERLLREVEEAADGQPESAEENKVPPPDLWKTLDDEGT